MDIDGRMKNRPFCKVQWWKMNFESLYTKNELYESVKIKMIFYPNLTCNQPDPKV